MQYRQRTVVAGLLWLTMGILPVGGAAAQSYTYESRSVPGATDTMVTGINASGVLTLMALFPDEGTFRTVYRGSLASPSVTKAGEDVQVVDVNDANMAVGHGVDEDGLLGDAFSWKAFILTRLKVPSSDWTVVHGNSSTYAYGQQLPTPTIGATSPIGWTYHYSTKAYKAVDPQTLPDCSPSVTGANSAGTLILSCYPEAYVLSSAGALTKIGRPSGTIGMQLEARRLNAQNRTLVIASPDATGGTKVRSFLYDITTKKYVGAEVKVAGAVHTWAQDLRDDGVIVGYSQASSGLWTGFIARPQQAMALEDAEPEED